MRTTLSLSATVSVGSPETHIHWFQSPPLANADFSFKHTLLTLTRWGLSRMSPHWHSSCTLSKIDNLLAPFQPWLLPRINWTPRAYTIFFSSFSFLLQIFLRSVMTCESPTTLQAWLHMTRTSTWVHRPSRPLTPYAANAHNAFILIPLLYHFLEYDEQTSDELN